MTVSHDTTFIPQAPDWAAGGGTPVAFAKGMTRADINLDATAGRMSPEALAVRCNR